MKLARKRRVLAIASIATTLALRPIQAQTNVEQWRQDLQVLGATLAGQAASVKANVTPAAFNAALAQLDAQIPALRTSDIIVGMAQIAALAQDGHTSLSLTQPAAGFRVYPIQLYWFKEGIYATAVGSPEAAPVLGKRLIRVEDTPVDDVVSRISSAISSDTTQWVRFKAPAYIALPELLSALGIVTSDNMSARFVFDGGAMEIPLTLLPAAQGATLRYRLPHAASPADPYYQRDPSFFYWTKYFDATQTLYIKYNVCSQDPTLRFQDFTAAVLGIIDSNSVLRFVIDLRNNEGGDTSVIQPLITQVGSRFASGVIPANAIAVAIIGRETFSSAVLNAVQFQQMGVTLIGEAAGWNPNGYGEVHTFTLPNSGLLVSYSTRRFSPGVPGSSLTPEIAVDWSWADYAAERDPFLDAALAIPLSDGAASAQRRMNRR
jgi:hypothetical protein